MVCQEMFHEDLKNQGISLVEPNLEARLEVNTSFTLWSCFSMSRAALHTHTLVYVCVSLHLLAFVSLQLYCLMELCL